MTLRRASRLHFAFDSNPFLTAFFTVSLENALKNYFPRLESAGSGPRAEFYNKFKREADEYDNDFLEKCRGDLDTTLIFVGPPLFFLTHSSRDVPPTFVK